PARPASSRHPSKLAWKLLNRDQQDLQQGGVDQAEKSGPRPEGRQPKESVMKTYAFGRAFAWGVTALAFTFAASANAADKEPIRIGASISLTSDMAIAGLQQKAGIQMAVDRINEAGGVPGKGENRPIEVIYGD